MGWFQKLARLGLRIWTCGPKGVHPWDAEIGNWGFGIGGFGIEIQYWGWAVGWDVGRG